MAENVFNSSTSRLCELFSRTREISAGRQRDRFLAEACQGNRRLQAEVESLLEADASVEGFLNVNASGGLSDSLTQTPGTLIGRYRILELLGEGGFGEVYRAEQTEPVKREVALKIIKLGMDTKEVIARFEAERQALALMNHPNIALVFDAGATELGRPFFVMELARGIPITDFCQQNGLPTALRLKLFIQVCAAVEHAHLKGIIHRDLKPSNMLVTLRDGEPVLKVIDFGIAKSLDVELTDRTASTRSQMILGTPSHMSPEQATGTGVSTASDLFSLGSVLYELLTDQPRLGTHTSVCATRQRLEQEEVSPLRINPKLDSDLATICLKCLEREPPRRYRSAGALTEDLEHWLRGESIVARPTRSVERLVRWSRRYPAAVALIVSLASGVLITTLLWREAAQQRDAKHLVASTMVGYVLGDIVERARAGDPVIRVPAEATLCFSRTPALYDFTAPRVTIAAVSQGRPDKVWEDLGPLVLYLQQHMERTLGHAILVDLDLLRDGEVVGQYITTGQVFLAEVPLHNFLEFGQGSGMPRVLVRRESRLDYAGVLVASPQSGISSVPELGGSSLVFGDANSALSLNARAHLQAAGFPPSAFEECVFLADGYLVRQGEMVPLQSSATGPNSRHAQSVEQVVNGTFDAGITYDHCLRSSLVSNSIVVLRRFPVIHGPWVGRIDEGVATAFVRAMCEIGRNSYREALGDDFERFVAASFEDYQPLLPAQGVPPHGGAVNGSSRARVLSLIRRDSSGHNELSPNRGDPTL